MGIFESSFWPKVTDRVRLVSQSGLTHELGLVEGGGGGFSSEVLMINKWELRGNLGLSVVVRRWRWLRGLERRREKEGRESEDGIVVGGSGGYDMRIREAFSF